jgi:hypothetical protein
MKVNIGPYTQRRAVREAGETRTIEVQIDDYDLWSLDHTLAQIIHPALVKFRDSVLSYPTVEDEDAPDADMLAIKYNHELQNIWPQDFADEETQELREASDRGYTRWLWVVDEMIFSFHAMASDHAWEDEYYERGASNEEIDEVHRRISNGTRLFGKYFRSLWN